MIKSAKILMLVYAGCVLQFILFYAWSKSPDFYMDTKLVLALSAVFGLLIGGVARRDYTDYLIKKSQKGLSKEQLNNINLNE